MNENYTLLAEIVIPCHDGEEESTTLRVYDITDECANDLCELCEDGGDGDTTIDGARIDAQIKVDLGVRDDYGVAPSSPFHRFFGRLELPHTVLLYDTLAYNI